MIKPEPKCVLVPGANRYRRKTVRSIRFDEPDLVVEIQGPDLASHD